LRIEPKPSSPKCSDFNAIVATPSLVVVALFCLRIDNTKATIAKVLSVFIAIVARLSLVAVALRLSCITNNSLIMVIESLITVRVACIAKLRNTAVDAVSAGKSAGMPALSAGMPALFAESFPAPQQFLRER